MTTRAAKDGKKVLPVFAVLALLAMAGCAGGCASHAGAAAAAAEEESVQIRIGQRVAVEKGALEIAFEAVTTDSRCPKGETCVWEGDAVVMLAVQAAGRPVARVELHTSPRGPSAAAYEDWSLRLGALEPYPVTGRTIPPDAYVATIVVTRGGAADVAIP
jgi:hypothetical protein